MVRQQLGGGRSVLDCHRSFLEQEVVPIDSRSRFDLPPCRIEEQFLAPVESTVRQPVTLDRGGDSNPGFTAGIVELNGQEQRLAVNP